MKISKPAIILSAVGLGLTLVYSQQSSSDSQSKAQQILRQKLADLKSGESLPGKGELLADVERLHTEGKISDEQYARMKKNINEQYAGPGDPADSEAQAKAQRILEQRMVELNARERPAVAPPSNTEAQARAQKVLEEKTKAQTSTAPAQPATPTVAEKALQQKIADLKTAEKPVAAPSSTETQAKAQKVLEEKMRAEKATAPAQPTRKPAVAEPVLEPKIAQARTEERTNIVPDKTTAALTPDAEAKARDLLRSQIEASRKTGVISPQPIPEAQAKAATQLQASDVEAKAGITPETSQRTRLLRLKIAESKGLITQAEATQAAAAPAAQAGATASANAASPVPFFTSNKEGMARLQELTEAYKADRITPHQYHHERAKIVSSL